MAEKEGFEPSRPFWGLHDFQSCALDQTTRLLRVCSTFCSAVLLWIAHPGQATMEILAGFCQKSSPFSKKLKKVFPPSGWGRIKGVRGRERFFFSRQKLQIEVMAADGAVVGPASVSPRVHGGHVEVETVIRFAHAVETEFGCDDAALVRYFTGCS